MKKLLLAGISAAAVTIGIAQAADLGYPAPARAAFSWSGCSLGGRAGSASGHATWQDPLPDGAIDATSTGRQTANTDMSGASYGGQLGCDWQPEAGNLVLGLRGALSSSTLAGTNMDQFNSTWTLRDKTDWFASLTGRLGWSVDRALLYGRGGVAWAHNRFEIENTGILDGTPHATPVGWVIGAGIEWAFAPNWSVFGEADYYSFGATTVTFPGDAVNPQAAFGVKTSRTMEILEFGANYRFANPEFLSERY